MNQVFESPVKNKDGHLIGKIIDGTLTKNVKGSKHMLRDPLGWAWDKPVIENCEKIGVMDTIITDTENGRVYCATIKDFLEKGKVIDRGFGPQIVLPMEFWTVRK